MKKIQKLNPFKKGTQRYTLFNAMASKPCKEYDFQFISQFHTRKREMERDLLRLGLYIDDSFKKTKTGNKSYQIKFRGAK